MKVGQTEGGELGTAGQCDGRTPMGIIYGRMALEAKNIYLSKLINSLGAACHLC
jgi:hypothetical protein